MHGGTKVQHELSHTKVLANLLYNVYTGPLNPVLYCRLAVLSRGFHIAL